MQKTSHTAFRGSTNTRFIRIGDVRSRRKFCAARNYAVVGTTTYVGKPPSPPSPPLPPFSPPPPPVALASDFDAQILSELRLRASGSSTGDSERPATFPELIAQYTERAGTVLDASLPYESRPVGSRKVLFDPSRDNNTRQEGAVAMVVHAVERGAQHKLAHCSGFAVTAPGLPEILVTCAHTFEEIRRDPLLQASSAGPDRHTTTSGSFIITGAPSAPVIRPVSAVLSALHRADLLLLSAHPSAQHPSASTSSLPASRTYPISPYPAPPGTRVRAHFVSSVPPTYGADAEGWRPWVGGTWSKWVRGTVLGYRDFAGREAQPGTYDALSHMLFDPPPTPGSSGGPIVDEESGAVVGVMLGTQLQNRIEGVRGWGAPAESIFEMFSLPGLKLKDG
ncbi:hypothetical protein B0H21DRAFT_690948 [Amylocystis lapponica]|nr:hypothetical protein B0H21DRAFT_690948 [Amylocystis lapponica]